MLIYISLRYAARVGRAASICLYDSEYVSTRPAADLFWDCLGAAVVLAVLGELPVWRLASLAQLIHAAFPALPVHTPLIYAALAVALSAVIGLLTGALPVRRASLLDPVESLRAG